MSLQRIVFSPLALAIVAALFVGANGFYLIHHEAVDYKARKRELIQQHVSVARTELEQGLNARFELAYALEGMVLSNPHVDELTFQQIAASMSRNYPSIRNIGLAPKAVVRYVYPPSDPYHVRGMDLLSLPGRAEQLRETIRDGKLRIAGPFKLVRGGFGLVIRYPIYLSDRQAGRTFWGLATVVLDFPRFIQTLVDISRNPDVEFAIRSADGPVGSRRVLFGSTSLFDDEPVLADVAFPNGRWEIAARPRGGWRSAPTEGLSVNMIVLLTATLAGLVMFLLRSRWLALDSVARLQSHSDSLKERIESGGRNLQVILDTAGVGITFVKERKQLWANRQMCEMFGYTESEIRGVPTRQFYASEADYLAAAREAYPAFSRGEMYHAEVKMRRRDGSVLWARLAGRAVDPANPEGGSIWVVEDIDRRRQDESQLRLAASVFSHSREGIVIMDAKGCIVDANEGFTEVTGYAREEVIDKNPRILRSTRNGTRFFRWMWRRLKTSGVWNGEVWIRRRDGSQRAVMLSIAAVLGSGGATQNYVGILSDITPIKRYQEALEHKATYDALTGLPNRALLIDRLQQAMREVRRREQSLVVAFIDLDGFKEINDRYGHGVGDWLLIALTQRMKGVLREGDTLGRRSGDEFIAVLLDLGAPADDAHVLERLLDAVSQPVSVNGVELRVSASIGFTVYPEDDSASERLIAHADEAMYEAKKAGKNRYMQYDITQRARHAPRQQELFG